MGTTEELLGSYLRYLDAYKNTDIGNAEKARLVDGQLLSWYGPRAIAGLGYLQDLSEAESS